MWQNSENTYDVIESEKCYHSVDLLVWSVTIESLLESASMRYSSLPAVLPVFETPPSSASKNEFNIFYFFLFLFLFANKLTPWNLRDSLLWLLLTALKWCESKASTSLSGFRTHTYWLRRLVYVKSFLLFMQWIQIFGMCLRWVFILQ